MAIIFSKFPVEQGHVDIEISFHFVDIAIVREIRIPFDSQDAVSLQIYHHHLC